jgi:hypothetical protein
MSEGFFSRWAKRKEAVRKGDVLPSEPELPPPQPSPSGEGSLSSSLPPLGEGQGGGTERQPLPTLEDAQNLTSTSDFTRFVQPDVPPEVKNAALKKLFADPHFNRMDGLDVYIDDYNKPDPLPPEMLRQMTSAKFLKLLDEEKQHRAPDESVAQSSTPPGDVSPPAAPHADPDLRLQQDDAPGPEGPGAGDR